MSSASVVGAIVSPPVEQQFADDGAGAGRARLEGLAHGDAAIAQLRCEARRLCALPASVPALEHDETTGHQVLAVPVSGVDCSPSSTRRARRTERSATMPAVYAMSPPPQSATRTPGMT